MNCPICDKELFLTNKHPNLACSNHYYASVEFFNNIIVITWEMFTYGKYKISCVYENGVIIRYNLFFPMIRGFGNCLKCKVEELDFDPKNPENVLNKLKTIVNFS